MLWTGLLRAPLVSHVEVLTASLFALPIFFCIVADRARKYQRWRDSLSASCAVTRKTFPLARLPVSLLQHLQKVNPDYATLLVIIWASFFHLTDYFRPCGIVPLCNLWHCCKWQPHPFISDSLIFPAMPPIVDKHSPIESQINRRQDLKESERYGMGTVNRWHISFFPATQTVFTINVIYLLRRESGFRVF